MRTRLNRGWARFARILSLTGVALLAGCAGSLRKSDPIPADPAGIQTFELNGRVNVKVKTENKSYPGKIRWQHVGPKEDLWIYTPLGTLIARLEQDAQSAAITNSQGESVKAGTLAFLARDVLGYDLPIDALQYWVRGLEWPQGHTHSLVRDAQGRLANLAQDQWEITIQAWTSPEGAALPTKLSAENREMKLALVIDQWRFNNLDRD